MTSRADHRTDSTLLVAARKDPDAFAVLYRRHVDGLLRYFRRRGPNAEQALDLTAETFAAALDSIDRYRPGPEPGVAWIYGIANNLLAQSARRGRIEDSARRRLNAEPLLVTDEGIATIEAIATSADEHDLLASALAELPAGQRDAVLARLVDERDYSDIATDLACSEQVVRQQVSRGLTRLRRQLLGDRS